MKKLVHLIVPLFFCFTLLSCGKREYQKVDLTNLAQPYTFKYAESKNIVNTLNIDSVQLSLPVGGFVSNFCVYADTLYYVVEYSDYLLDQTGERGNIPFEEKYNTQIRAYDLECKKDWLIYQYNVGKCKEVTDLVCNGTQIAWEDYIGDEWSVQCMVLNTEQEPTTIVSEETQGGELWSITLSITQEGLYWFNVINDEKDNFMGLFKYDFDTAAINNIQEKISLTSPYEHYTEINESYATYEIYKTEEEEKGYIIHAINKGTNQQIDLYIDEMVCVPKTNGKICVWKKSFEASDAQKIYIYDFLNSTFEVIEAEHFSSYVLFDKYLITNQQGKIICYDIQNKVYEELFPYDESYCSYLYFGTENNAYFEKKSEGETYEYINISEAP